MSFTEHLAGLDARALTALLAYRCDLLAEPVPHSIDELAMRLNGNDSLALVLPDMDRDQYDVATTVAMLGGSPSAATVAARLRAAEGDVARVIDELCALGLAWHVRGRLGLPPRLAEHFAAGLAGFRPLGVLAKQARVEELRVAVGGLGEDPEGMRKPELVARLSALLTDPDTVARAVAGLSPSARQQLSVLGRSGGYFHGRPAAEMAVLVRSGLLLGSGSYGNPDLPREVAVLLLIGAGKPLAGRPQLGPSADPEIDGRAGAEAALLALTTLLDAAGSTPLAALKKGGIGTRERTRLSTRLGVSDPAMWIDVAFTAGLLAPATGGYSATAGYEDWREREPSVRWAQAALAWWALDLAPTSRETDDGEVPPPLPLGSGGGMVRRALLRAAAGGLSLRAAGEHLDWFCPLHPYDDTGRHRKVAGTPGAADELAQRSVDLLPATRGLLVLQSDLTAVVSGQPSAGAARLLAAAAVSEGRGVAAVWRFTPVTVRAALDAGWTADELRAGLLAMSDRPLPQPLDYLITDVARRHGGVRLRGSCTCVTGAEAEVAEMLHTRSLRSLHLSLLAPTVLTSPFELDVVLAKLRGAGFSPMPEDADGVVIVQQHTTGTAPAARAPRSRPRMAPADLAARLLAAEGSDTPESATHSELVALTPRLDTAQVALLAHALDQGADVRITYRNSAGNRTVRVIRPQELYGRWISAWCHLRSAGREFSVAGIEEVAPVG
ncbi:MAG: helicase-associated domain-containing protein [Pseudonocardia sp.]|nr:helicase-associated domain-containing protein [Pseudonocardia sp.]